MGKTGDYSCLREQAAIGSTFIVNGWALPLQCTQLCTTVQSPYSALSALGAQGRGWRSMYSMTCVRVFKTSQSPGEVFIKYSHPWESLLMIDDVDVGTIYVFLYLNNKRISDIPRNLIILSSIQDIALLLAILYCTASYSSHISVTALVGIQIIPCNS